MRHTVSSEAWNIINSLLDGEGTLCARSAKEGNSKAKAVMDAYKMFYAKPESASESIFIQAYKDWSCLR